MAELFLHRRCKPPASNTSRCRRREWPWSSHSTVGYGDRPSVRILRGACLVGVDSVCHGSRGGRRGTREKRAVIDRVADVAVRLGQLRRDRWAGLADDHGLIGAAAGGVALVVRVAGVARLPVVRAISRRGPARRVARRAAADRAAALTPRRRCCTRCRCTGRKLTDLPLRL